MKSGAAIWVWVVGLALWAAIVPAVRAQAYQPPEVASAGDAYTPFLFIMDGFAALDVHVGADGAIEKLDALRNPGSMLDAAKGKVRSWKFGPGREDGKAIASRITVCFVYPPTNYTYAVPAPADSAPVLPAAEQPSPGSGSYRPVGILAFAYPAYPVNSVAWGSVVIQVTVDSAGAVKGVAFLHKMDVFNKFALEALKQWRFRAAAFNGKPIEAKAVIAFSFQPPRSTGR